MRVTSTSMFQTMAQGLSTGLGEVQRYQNQLSTGRRITAWSDDPSGAAAAQRLRATESDWNSYRDSAHDARGWLDAADGALQNTSDTLRRVQELAISARSGALSPTSREAIAREMDQMKDQLGDLANTEHLGRSLFGGFGDKAVTKTGGTYTWAGTPGEVKRQLGPEVSLSVNLTADDVFGFSSGRDVFSIITDLTAAVRADNGAGIDAAQGDLAVRARGVSQNLGVVGAVTNRVEASLRSADDATATLQTVRSSIEDADIAYTILKLNQAQTGYQAALGAAARANVPSLAEFLR